MDVLVDKIIIFFICLFSLMFLSIHINVIIVVLAAISISSLCYYFSTPKTATLLIIFYYGLCLINPAFCIFLPLFLYDIICFRLKYIALAGIFILLQYWNQSQIIHIVISIFGCCIAIIIQNRTEKYTKLKIEHRKLRDTSKELNMYLSNKNKMLMERQEYEIHLATLQERNRIAREIHDNVGHMLSRSLLQVGALMTISKEEVMSQNLLLLKDTLNDAMNSIRESIHDLHGDSIDLFANLKEIIDKFPDYKIYLNYDISEHATMNLKYCFIMVVKEALSNVAKHSNADRIEIIATEHPRFYQLLIKDNGTNIAKKNTQMGMGLENMKSRVQNLNGNVTIENENGFKIFITIPKKEEDGRDMKYAQNGGTDENSNSR